MFFVWLNGVQLSGFGISSVCLFFKVPEALSRLIRRLMGNGPNPMFTAIHTLTIYGSNINRPI